MTTPPRLTVFGNIERPLPNNETTQIPFNGSCLEVARQILALQETSPPGSKYPAKYTIEANNRVFIRGGTLDVFKHTPLRLASLEHFVAEGMPPREAYTLCFKNTRKRPDKDAC